MNVITCDVATTLRTFFLPTEVFELRIPWKKGSRSGADGGWFDDVELAADAAARYDSCKGVYFSLNPPLPELIHRDASNRILQGIQTTSDAQIVSRRWIPIDLDCERPSDISASDDEKKRSFIIVDKIVEYLAEMGFPQPITADSGNGFHLHIPVTLPNDDASKELVKRFLQALSTRFSRDGVKVDESVFNAARIMKLYGTWARKGSNTEQRPHRQSKLLYVPDYLEGGPPAEHDTAKANVLQRVIDDICPPDEKPTVGFATKHRNGYGHHSPAGDHRLDVQKWLTSRGIEFRDGVDNQGNKQWFILCPFNPDHGLNDKDTYVAQSAAGALWFKCSHDRCKDFRWHDVKQVIGEPSGDDYDPPKRMSFAEASKRFNGRMARANQLQAEAQQLACDVIHEVEPDNAIHDPGIIPRELLCVPGLINDVTEFTITTAPYPNRPLAFAGALSLMSVLTARKVRAINGTRPNIYVLGLADSGIGKEWARTINYRILDAIGMADVLCELPASSAGLEDRLLETPALLCQADEFDELLRRLATGKDPLANAYMAILLKLFGRASSMHRTRDKAGAPGAMIKEPSFTLLGTAIPATFYESLTADMARNGALSRLLTFHADPRPKGREAIECEIPPTILDAAQYWADRPTAKSGESPSLMDVQTEPSTERRLTELTHEYDTLWEDSQKNGDQAGMALWCRAREKVNRLSLLYATSANPIHPRIGSSAVDWASQIVVHNTKKMLASISEHSYETEFEKCAKKVLGIVDRLAATTEWAPQWRILKASKMSSDDLTKVLGTLVEAHQLDRRSTNTKGRPVAEYRVTGRSRP